MVMDAGLADVDPRRHVGIAETVVAAGLQQRTGTLSQYPIGSASRWPASQQTRPVLFRAPQCEDTYTASAGPGGTAKLRRMRATSAAGGRAHRRVNSRLNCAGLA
ncbi:hypothetical protein G6F32_016241 [Rhizopus arrhizus]|nr:hypothetical protein G6F32_016241 [Rhizopus arrhizus]